MRICTCHWTYDNVVDVSCVICCGDIADVFLMLRVMYASLFVFAFLFHFQDVASRFYISYLCWICVFSLATSTLYISSFFVVVVLLVCFVVFCFCIMSFVLGLCCFDSLCIVYCAFCLIVFCFFVIVGLLHGYWFSLLFFLFLSIELILRDPLFLCCLLLFLFLYVMHIRYLFCYSYFLLLFLAFFCILFFFFYGSATSEFYSFSLLYALPFFIWGFLWPTRVSRLPSSPWLPPV